jgi:hypothetical protein
MLARIVRSAAALVVLTLSVAGMAARAEEVKLPQTAEDHLAMAKSYAEKATTWRNEAALHREMAAAYKKANPDLKGGIRHSEAVKMEKHCMAIVKDAEKLAADAEESAKFHSLRAKEMQGQ